MLRRASRALRYAVHEEEFLPVLGSGLLLVVIGTQEKTTRPSDT
jgi:hypothetical protein